MTVRLASSLLPAASVMVAVMVCGPLPRAVTSRQRNADAPVAGSVQRGGVGFTV
ncbi:hypothetical protein HT118_19330 [Escherichia coli]|nr:hypothetical protein [Escherichia coli]